MDSQTKCTMPCALGARSYNARLLLAYTRFRLSDCRVLTTLQSEIKPRAGRGRERESNPYPFDHQGRWLRGSAKQPMSTADRKQGQAAASPAEARAHTSRQRRHHCALLWLLLLLLLLLFTVELHLGELRTVQHTAAGGTPRDRCSQYRIEMFCREFR